MRLLNVFQRVFGGAQVDLEQRFEINEKRWAVANNGRFNRVMEKKTEQEFLLKLIDAKKSKKYRAKFPGKGFPAEVEISSSFQHENIFLPTESGSIKSGDEFLLYDVSGWNSLGELIRRREPRVRKHAYSLIRQLANALIKIHSDGYVHRDVCPRNIFLDANFENLKLVEFGYCVPNAPEYGRVKNRTGTPLYMAPEIVRMQETDIGVDIFSFGITVFQLLSFKHPWGVEENSSRSTLQFDTRPAEDIRTYLPKFKEPKAKAIARCLDVKSDQRFNNLKQFLMMSGIK